MADEAKGTSDQGKQVTTPDPGKNVTPEQVQKIVADAVSAALAPFTQSFDAITKTVNGLAADKRRGTEKTEPKGDSKASDEEVTTLRDELKLEREERRKDKKKLALKDALDAVNDTIAGRGHLERLIGTELDFDSTGNVVAVVDGKHVPLKDRVKQYAADPLFQKPSGTDGTGKPDGSNGSGSGGSKKIQIKRNDLAAKAQYRAEILKGQVEFVD
jgi:hypothetical protein